MKYVLAARASHYAKDCRFDSTHYPECGHYYQKAYEDGADLHDLTTYQKYNIPWEHPSLIYLGKYGWGDKRDRTIFDTEQDALTRLWDEQGFWEEDDDGNPYYFVEEVSE